VCVCVCVRERERLVLPSSNVFCGLGVRGWKRERQRGRLFVYGRERKSVYESVGEREREREREREVLSSVCCSVLQCAAVCCSVLQCVAVCCSVLACCSVLQCLVVCCIVLHCAAVCSSVLQCVAVCCSVLQCVAVCCSVLQYAAVCCNKRTREIRVLPAGGAFCATHPKSIKSRILPYKFKSKRNLNQTLYLEILRNLGCLIL